MEIPILLGNWFRGHDGQLHGPISIRDVEQQFLKPSPSGKLEMNPTASLIGK